MIALVKVIRSGGATATAQCRLPAPHNTRSQLKADPSTTVRSRLG